MLQDGGRGVAYTEFYEINNTELYRNMQLQGVCCGNLGGQGYAPPEKNYLTSHFWWFLL